jgi:hypothetical protein
LLVSLKRRARGIRLAWLRANKARRPFGLAGLRPVWGRKRERAPELMRGKPSRRMSTPAPEAEQTTGP